MWAQCTAVAPDPLPGGTLDTGGCYVKGKSVMVPPKQGSFGTMGRNLFRDTGFKNVDFSVFKTFKFKERYNATFQSRDLQFVQSPHHLQPVWCVEWPWRRIGRNQ